MKKTFACIIALAASALAFTGCYKDDSTSYQFDVPGVKILADDTKAFAVGEESVFEPVIEWDGTSENDYTYVWTLEGFETISTERVLRYKFQNTGDAYLTFQMKDKKTGVVFGQDFKCTVSTLFSLGWLVLSEGDDHSSKLSFIHMTNFDLYPDVFAEANPGVSLGTNPQRLSVHNIAKSDQVLVQSNNGKDLIEVNGWNFKKASELKYEFIGEKYPDEGGEFGAAFVAYNNRSAELLISNNGLIYDRVWPTSPTPTSSSATFQNLFFSPQAYPMAVGDYRITYCTYPGDNAYYLPLYDSLKRRWLAYFHATTTTYSIPEFVCTAKFPDGYNWCTGMAADVNLKYAETYNISSYKSNLLQVLERGGVYTVETGLLTYATATHKITVTTPAQKTIPASAGITDKTVFCMPHGTGTNFANNPHVFFSVGKKVYFFYPTDGKVYLYRDFSKDENAPSGDVVGIDQNGNASQLAISFEDGHVFICNISTTIVNGIRQSNIDPEKVDNGILAAHVSGVPGKIVDVNFKYGKVANYTGYKIAY